MSLCSIEQGVRIELGGKFRDGYHRLPLEAVRRVLGALLLLVDLYPVFAGKVLQRLGVGHLLVLHDECHGAAGLAAPEALEDALARGDRERGGLLVVEGTRVTKSLMTSTISVASSIFSTVALSIIGYKNMEF